MSHFARGDFSSLRAMLAGSMRLRAREHLSIGMIRLLCWAALIVFLSERCTSQSPIGQVRVGPMTEVVTERPVPDDKQLPISHVNWDHVFENHTPMISTETHEFRGPSQIDMAPSWLKPRDESDFAASTAKESATNWWDKEVGKPIRSTDAAVPVDVAGLFEMTLLHSHRIQAVQQTPWISGTQVLQAQGAFDPRWFHDTNFDSTSDPAESTLATGGPPRLNDDVFGFDGGLRVQTPGGSSYTVGQRFGHKNSNSLFIDPNNQASSRLYANWTKPLVRGRTVNPQQSLVLTAQFSTAAEEARYLQTVQSQLSDVGRAYWNLYVERSKLLLQRRNLERAVEITDQLEQRQSLDAVQSQLLRARGAVANRKAELILSESRIRNIESQLRSLINAPGISERSSVELLPIQTPPIRPLRLDIESEVAAAVSRRPEIQELRHKLRSKGVQLALARDQTKAQLNFVLEGNLAGLEGDSDFYKSWTNQFTTGRPSFGIGFEYELPYRNRTAIGAVRQRRLEITQFQHLINEMLGNTRAEVETAIRNLEASFQTSAARRESVAAVKAELAYLEDRWESLGNDPQLGQLELNDLLDAQVRLLQEQISLLDAQAQHAQALIELQRATGSLVEIAK